MRRNRRGRQILDHQLVRHRNHDQLSVDATGAQQWKATLLIACKPQDAGCQLRISCGDSMHEFVVVESDDLSFKQIQKRVQTDSEAGPTFATRHGSKLAGIFRRDSVTLVTAFRKSGSSASIALGLILPRSNLSNWNRQKTSLNVRVGILRLEICRRICPAESSNLHSNT
jgi:hypothetical protein